MTPKFSFRFALPDFNVDKFKGVLSSVISELAALREETFKEIDFDKHETKIKRCFNLLSRLKGVEYTGASKVLNLLLPKLFVM